MKNRDSDTRKHESKSVVVCGVKKGATPPTKENKTTKKSNCIQSQNFEFLRTHKFTNNIQNSAASRKDIFYY